MIITESKNCFGGLSSFRNELNKKRRANCAVTYCAGHHIRRAQLTGKDGTDNLSNEHNSYMSFLFSILSTDPSFLYPQTVF